MQRLVPFDAFVLSAKCNRRTPYCYKAYPGLGNRSIFYPGSSAGSTITFGVDGRTRVRIPLRTFLLEEMLARASYYKHVSLGPQDLDEVWVGTYDRIRRPVNRYVPKIPPFQGGENVIRLTLGWVIDRSFTPVAQKVAPSHCHPLSGPLDDRKRDHDNIMLSGYPGTQVPGYPVDPVPVP